MGVLHMLLVQASVVIARVLEHQIRQGPGLPLDSSSSSSQSPTSSVSSPTQSSSRPAETTSSNNEGRDEGGDDEGGTSPLLFFVALGFGVVFTNLW